MALAMVVAMVAGVLMLIIEDTAAVSDPSDGFIDDVPATTPSTLGDLDLTELQYGDPAEALALIQPPKADVDGGAGLAHPLPVPPGRADVQPDLALTYDSNGGSGWVGVGWDLSVGAVTVDTEFGAPRYLSGKESETYLLDGERLHPNAIRTVLEDRQSGPRADWVRQIEDDHDLIVRHGDTPSTYCWQVSDTEGNQLWYGGAPDANGDCARDESAILTAPATGAPGGVSGDYHWALTYVEDISGNVMRFSYDEVTGVPIGRQSEAAIGVSLYLSEITYTGFANTDAAPDEPAYRVRFLRDGDVSGATARLDVTVDASAGQPVVVRDLLRRVEVDYLSPDFYDTGAAAQLVKGWTLDYDENGPFDKSLLTRVGQFGSDGAGNEHAWHTFTYFDDVTDPNTGGYAGFSEPEQWGTGTSQTKVNIAAESALGTQWRAGADGGSYIGFNPVIPNKIGSFGGSFNIAGGQSNEVSTLVDLDGDSLPDRVWLSGGTVMYKPNLNRPGGTQIGGSWFGPTQTITGIDSLGRSSDLGIDLHFEAYPVIAIQVGGSFGFDFGDRYFEDVNGDGRVDFIKPGSAGGHTVFYNVLDDNGVPMFIDSSLADQLTDRLEVPLDDFASVLADATVDEVADLLVNTSPRIDTVRRWLAPHTGTIRVQGTATLTTGTDYRGDGAQVTVEHNDTQHWVHTLDATTTSQSHDFELAVSAGDAVWFRLHVIENAADDEVSWDPTITYLTGSGGSTLSAAVDANNRSQVVFDASDDFTLFGRSGATTSLSEPGDLTVSVTVNTLAGLSDDLEVVLIQGHGDDTPQEHPVLTVPQLTVGATSGSVDLIIAAPTTDPGDDGVLGTNDDVEETDFIDIQVFSDSPVDPTAFSVDITTTAAPVDDSDLDDIPSDADVNIPLDVPLVPNVRVFARTKHTTPYVPLTSPDKDRMKAANIEVVVKGLSLDGGNAAIDSTAVLTVKTLTDGVVARQEFIVEHVTLGGATVLEGTTTLSDFTPERNTTYYIDVSLTNPVVAAAVELETSTVTWKWTVTEQDSDGNDVDVDKTEAVTDAGQLHWPDADGMFPSANRGWAYAGYNADHANANGGGPLVQSQFQFEAESSGFDEDEEVPTAGNAPSASGVRGGVATSFDPSLPYVPWSGDGGTVADRWRAGEKETLHGKAASMQADRLGADTPIEGLTTTGRQAPQMLSIDGDFNFMLGLVLSFTAAVGGGRALKDYEDFNGDGYPDIRNGSDIEFTGPRGGLAATTSSGDDSFETALAVGGGINGSAISISSTGGSSRNDDGGDNNVEPTTSKTSRGMKIGLGFDISAQWTNPIADGEAYGEIFNDDPDAPDILGDREAELVELAIATGASGLIMDRAFIDINGDGLPDRVDTYTSGELWVALNLGYRFSDDEIQWSTGRTASNKDVGGSIAVGFEINAYEFAGGIAYSESVGYSLFDWLDVDGDGVPDRMDNEEDGQPQTVFGSGDGMLRDEIVYGTFPNGSVAVDADRFGDDELPGVDLPVGQMEVSRSTGLSGGVDFTFYIGPICVVACYIVVNPGFHGGYDRMRSQIQTVDMNGDGYLDAVRSTDFEHVEVRLNQRRRTNMLQSVTNPLGGQIRLDYERTGNTIANPESVWVMSSIEVDDGRAGDGPSVQRSEFTYSGNAYDPLLRELLGFSFIREDQIDENGIVQRSFERDYLNANPFETGILTEERTLDRDGNVLRVASFDWVFVNADPLARANGAYGSVVTGLPEVGKTARTLLFDTALSARLVTDRLTQWDGFGRDDPAAQSQTVATHYTYNEIGDVLTVHEENEDEIDEDDTFTVITYTDCATRGGSRILGANDTWVSVPQTITVYGNDGPSGERLRYRNGGPAQCGNATPIRITELVAEDDGSGCGPLFAVTELSFDTHGSYNAVAHPSNALPTSCADYPAETVTTATFQECSSLSAADDAARYCVDYVYDDHRFTSVAQVTDNHGVSAGATYDPLTGRLASRTDESGNLTTYTYDAQGRVSTITAPLEQGGTTPTMQYAYGGLTEVFDQNGAHAWATASHFDVFNAGNTIDTVSFVDGMGRVVQRKRDAEVDGVVGEARIVEGAVEFDALGREIKEWYPVVETDTDFTISQYNTWTSELGPATTNVPATQAIVRTFDTYDRLLFQQLPDDSVETIEYDFEVLPDPGPVYDAPITMSRTRTTDPLGKLTTRFLDVGGAVFLRVDSPIAANDPDGAGGPLAALPNGDVIDEPRVKASTGTPGDITTTYEYDRLGRLTAVIDTVGARTEHTYDRRNSITSTGTPDAGLVQRTFAPSGQLLTLERAVGTVSTYSYDRDRLVGVDYSDATPDVTYEYGNDGAADNGAGRVTRVIDGAMDRTYGYDADGNVSRETATQDENPFGISVDPNPKTWETTWVYDSLGRIAVLGYPDGEDLGHEYDLGGRPTRLVSQAPQHDLYDQFGNAVPRPDVEIVYIDEVRYDQFGEPTFMRTGTGVETSYQREPTRRFLASIDTDVTAVPQFDGSVPTARPLQRLAYTYDAVGNIRDVTNLLYATGSEAAIAEVPPPPDNNVPGASHQALTYDGHYRLTGGAGTYIDQKENRDFTYATDYAPNGNLLEKEQVTTTTSTTGNSGGNNGNRGNSGNGKKGNGSVVVPTEPTCESDTGSGGGSFNQDPETTYAYDVGALEYADDGGVPLHRLIRAGTRDYTYDANGNMTGWVQDCAQGNADISRTYEWDAENRVIRMAEDNNDTDLRYNAEGARTLERGAGGTTWFVNEHWRTVNEGHRYANVFIGEQLVASHRTSSPDDPPAPCTPTVDNPCECDEDTACQVDITECDLTARIYDAATGTCQPPEERTIHFIHKDLQGSLRVATDEVGKVFQYMDYLPTGRPWVAGQSTIKDTPFLFGGGWTDTTYDLVNFGERWYDPREENFMSPEPLLEEAPYSVVDDPSMLAAYTYAAANPLRYVDPDGRAANRAITGFDLGDQFQKHEQGNITISQAQRAKRESPKITFGGRYTNDAKGQQLGEAFKEHADKAEKFATILTISTEDGVRTISISGFDISEKRVGEQPAPDPGPGDSGADREDAALDRPDVAGDPPQPDARDVAEQGDADIGEVAGGDGAADAAGPARPPDAGADGQDAPANERQEPPEPAAAAPNADGPDNND